MLPVSLQIHRHANTGATGLITISVLTFVLVGTAQATGESEQWSVAGCLDILSCRTASRALRYPSGRCEKVVFRNSKPGTPQHPNPAQWPQRHPVDTNMCSAHTHDRPSYQYKPVLLPGRWGAVRGGARNSIIQGRPDVPVPFMALSAVQGSNVVGPQTVADSQVAHQ